MSLIMSPSNILNHMKCPLQAWAMREKLIPWKETPQKNRGTSIHSALEEACNTNFALPVLPDGCDSAYVSDTLNLISNTGACHKLKLFTEHAMAVNRKMKKVEFFADDVFFRARADLLMLNLNKRFAIIGDWKTGKIYPESEDQMRLESILVTALYGVQVVHWKLFYVDQGKTKQGSVDFTKGLAPVKDLLDIMKDMQDLDRSNGPWVAKKNKFCKWCDWYHGDCQDSNAW